MSPVVLAATPIGDAGDASARLRTLLSEADVVAAEDTRKLADLARRLDVQVRGRVISHHEHNEGSRVVELLDVVRSGGTVAVVSDAGMPTVSDPGLSLVRAAIAADLPVTVLPGPSAVLTALAVSGLPTDRFCFEGFVPRRPGARDAALQALAREARTLVMFESPHRLVDTLEAAARSFGADRPAAVCRELTKTHEEVSRGPLGALTEQWAARAAVGDVRGEIVLVVGGAPDVVPAITDLVAEVLDRVTDGERLKDVVSEIAGATGVSKRELYSAALAARASRGPAVEDPTE